MSGGKNSVTMRVDMSSLQRLVSELAGDSDAAARPAAQAAAQVLYVEVQRNVAAIRKHSGNLAAAIYQAFSPSNSGDGRATYHVSWRTSKSSALRRAPHGHLVEFGHLQRYEMYKGSDGQIRPKVRPGMENKPRPKSGAGQAEKDAYFVTLPGGPRQVAARPFLRPALAKAKEALDAAEAVYLRQILGRKP